MLANRLRVSVRIHFRSGEPVLTLTHSIQVCSLSHLICFSKIRTTTIAADDDKYSLAVPTGEDNDGDAANTGKFTDDDGGW